MGLGYKASSPDPSNRFPPRRLYHLMVTQLSQVELPVRDLVFKSVILRWWGGGISHSNHYSDECPLEVIEMLIAGAVVRVGRMKVMV